MRHLICEWWELARASVVQDSQWHPAHLGEWFQINRSCETLKDDSLCKSPALCLCWAWALPSLVPPCTNTPLLCGFSIPWQSDFRMALIFTAHYATPFPSWSSDGATSALLTRWGQARRAGSAASSESKHLLGLGVTPFPGMPLPEAIIQMHKERMIKKIAENSYNGHIQCWFMLWVIWWESKGNLDYCLSNPYVFMELSWLGLSRGHSEHDSVHLHWFGAGMIWDTAVSHTGKASSSAAVN